MEGTCREFRDRGGTQQQLLRRAKILATLGPATRDPKIFEALLAAGVDGVRINMSHGTQNEKAEDIRMARLAAAVSDKLELWSDQFGGGQVCHRLMPMSRRSAVVFRMANFLLPCNKLR